MGSNRKQPFGYKMMLGEIVIQEQEAEIVRQIFSSYIAGKAYSAIADELQSRTVPYDKDKPWNKNMIARILADERYIGKNDCPAIIAAETLESAARQRTARQKPIHQTAVQKVLRRLSGHTVTADMEQQVLELLGGLVKQPEKIVSAGQEYTPLADVAALKEELALTLNGQPINEDRAKQIIQQIAAAEYAAIDNTAYETERLRHLFGTAKPLRDLDVELLKSTVSEVTVCRNRLVSIRLKNGQVLERSENA